MMCTASLSFTFTGRRAVRACRWGTAAGAAAGDGSERMDCRAGQQARRRLAASARRRAWLRALLHIMQAMC